MKSIASTMKLPILVLSFLISSGSYATSFRILHYNIKELDTAKIEKHKGEKVCVHRKGATRAFGPGSRDVPSYNKV